VGLLEHFKTLQSNSESQGGGNNMNDSNFNSPRTRRTKAAKEQLLNAVINILNAETGQITIRHLYYCLVGFGIIEKTEKAYHQLCDHLSKWRRGGLIEWDAFTDGTRGTISPTTFIDVPDALSTIMTVYRRDVWEESQKDYIEIFIEKDAMLSVIRDVTDKYLVPLFSCRGFSSLSALSQKADTFRKKIDGGKNITVYHLGDWDPSGCEATKAIRNTFNDDFNLGINIIRLALNEEHIKNYNLPTRPVKSSDTRSKNWVGECVEIDAMPTVELNNIIEKQILTHIDLESWNKVLEQEKQDILKLREICQ
jgi:hypothetical protein